MTHKITIFLINIVLVATNARIFYRKLIMRSRLINFSAEKIYFKIKRKIRAFVAKYHLRNLKYSSNSCFPFFKNLETISIPITEKVMPFPPKPKTKYVLGKFGCSPM